MNKTAHKISRLPSFSRERNILSFNKELSVSQSAQMQNNNTTQTILTEHCRAVATSPQADKALAENRAVRGVSEAETPDVVQAGGSLHSSADRGIVRWAAVFVRHRNITNKSCPFPILLADLRVRACVHFQWSQGGGLCCDSMDMLRVANT